MKVWRVDSRVLPLRVQKTPSAFLIRIQNTQIPPIAPSFTSASMEWHRVNKAANWDWYTMSKVKVAIHLKTSLNGMVFFKKTFLITKYYYIPTFIYIFFNLQQRLLRFSRRRWGQRTSHCCPNQRQLKFSKFHNILWLLLVTTTVPFLRYYISLLNSYVNVKTIWAIIFNLYIKKYFFKSEQYG